MLLEYSCTLNQYQIKSGFLHLSVIVCCMIRFLKFTHPHGNNKSCSDERWYKRWFHGFMVSFQGKDITHVYLSNLHCWLRMVSSYSLSKRIDCANFIARHLIYFCLLRDMAENVNLEKNDWLPPTCGNVLGIISRNDPYL